MGEIKYKEWIFDDDLSVQDIIDLMGNQEDPIKYLELSVKILQEHKTKGPQITTKISIKDFKKLQEEISKAFL